jgi:hypothetical protein
MDLNTNEDIVSYVDEAVELENKSFYDEQIADIKLNKPLNIDEDVVINNTHNYTEDDLNRFKKDTAEFFDLDDKITGLLGKIRELRKEKNIYTTKILDFMKNSNINDIHSNNKKLKYVKTEEKIKLNKLCLKNKLNDFFKNENNALECYKFLNNRKTILKEKLKIVKK